MNPKTGRGLKGDLDTLRIRLHKQICSCLRLLLYVFSE